MRFPLNWAFLEIPVSFIRAYVAGGNIRLNLALLIPQMQSDSTLTLIDIPVNILDGGDAAAHLDIDVSIILLAKIRAIGDNPAVINNHSIKIILFG